jgi:hypothetical protein
MKFGFWEVDRTGRTAFAALAPIMKAIMPMIVVQTVIVNMRFILCSLLKRVLPRICESRTCVREEPT